MDKYKNKLLKEKIQSMNQNDRIEFGIIYNFNIGRIDRHTIAALISYTSCFLFLIIGLFFILLNTFRFKFIGIFSIILFTLFLSLSLILLFLAYKIEKESEKRLEEFIEERTRKK